MLSDPVGTRCVWLPLFAGAVMTDASLELRAATQTGCFPRGFPSNGRDTVSTYAHFIETRVFLPRRCWYFGPGNSLLWDGPVQLAVQQRLWPRLARCQEDAPPAMTTRNVSKIACGGRPPAWPDEAACRGGGEGPCSPGSPCHCGHLLPEPGCEDPCYALQAPLSHTLGTTGRFLLEPLRPPQWEVRLFKTSPPHPRASLGRGRSSLPRI